MLESEKMLHEYEDVVFRGKFPRKKERKIEVEYDERYHAETDGFLGIHRDLADGVLKLATNCEVPF